MKRLVRIERSGVHIVGCVGGAIAFGFTERTGGVSTPPFASLNLGAHVGDDPQAVVENRRRVLRAVGASSCAENLLVPNQVHGDHVAVVRSSDPSVLEAVRAEIADGSDAIVCTAPDVPVMLCFADCVPVILTAPGGFAVVHSGWKGTYAGIAGTAARVLAREASCAPGELCAYIGPHILGDEYEVSTELIDRFDARFEDAHPSGSRLLDLSRCIVQSLVEAGMPEASVADTGLSTIRQNDRFFSYRAEAGTCGRHAAVAIMRSSMNGGA